MNQAIHNIDILNWLIDSEVIKTKALIKNFNHSYIEVEDFGVAIVEYKNDSVGIIEATTTTYPENLEETLSIFSEKGTIKIGGKSLNVVEEWKVKGDSRTIEQIKLDYSENPENIYGFGHFSLMKDIIEAIDSNKEPYVTAYDGLKALDLVIKVYNASGITKFDD
jgi:predicted dehydrogenase